MMRLLLVLLCGCNAVFGLDETKSIAGLPDRDEDGVVDVADNCIEVSNATQDDGDADGFGDACDACPARFTLLNHDEDGDGRGDDCDLCPGQPEFEGDADGDGIGDTCDDLSGVETRVLFDTFRQLDATWTAGTIEWRAQNDAVSPVATLPAGDPGLRATDLVFDAVRPWSVHVGVHAKTTWKTNDFGVRLLADDNTVIASCMIECTSRCMLVGTYGPFPYSTPQDPSPMLHLVFSIEPTSNGYVSTTCDRIGTVAALSTPGSPAGHLAIVASPNVEITYVEVLR